MRVFSIVGWSGSGKTRLICQLIVHFKNNKKRIFVLKNIPHLYSLQPETKDSYKFLESGADWVYLNSQEEIICMKRKKGQDEILEMVFTQKDKPDMILIEGLTTREIPIIEVFDSARNRELKFPLNKLSAIVSDKRIEATIPCFLYNDIENIAQFMEGHRK